ncbi:hypothetical protein CLV84_0872 [Neolewinella xylanilytica]|uniref:Uncharacterized protein n=1 Tax=Neolewinella xylanilytica TaxID=1514080 RepID=A0A2S6I8V0_9BACT|nr:hypothetical protein [Neolewinella xylanilytica]PPK87913.1 hypothetical protein CLV84_0872 [Neolewinella xylanilytica]
MTTQDAQEMTRRYCKLETRLYALAGSDEVKEYNAILHQLRELVLHPEVRLEYAPMEATSEAGENEAQGEGVSIRRKAVTRRLLKITRYAHPTYGDLYAAYLSSPLPTDLETTDLAVCFWWGETKTGKRGMVCRYYWPRIPGRSRQWQFQSGDESITFARLTPGEQWCFLSPTGDPGQEAEYLSNR